MLNKFLNLFVDPDDSDPTFIRLVRNILIFTIIASVASIGILINTPDASSLTIAVIGIMLLIIIVSLVFVIRGQILLAKLMVPLALTIAITVIANNANTIHDISILAYPLIITIANLLQGRRSSFTTTPLVLAAIVLLGVLDMTGISTNPIAERTGIDDILIGTVLIASGAGILNLLVGRLRSALLKAEESEHLQIQTNKELTSLKDLLEKRVQDRTYQLESANQRNEKRARQFEAIAQVARATTTNENLNDLLPRLVSVISDQFGFYHTGIFLFDEERKNAVLRATNSEGGRRMLSRGHKLQIGQTGIVGFVSGTGTPRIALDVGSDAVFFNNPDLPNTHSEMGLPLRAAGEVIGVLDVQSTESNAFQQEDIEVLETLADQVSVAIQNSRSFESMQQLLQEAQKTSSSFLGDAWQDVQQSEDTHIGYRAFGEDFQAYNKPLTSAQIQKAMDAKQTVIENGKKATLAVPIRLHNEVIGIVDIQTSVEHEWDEDEVDIAEAVAERLSLAIETSLLLRSTQRRAEFERVTAEISGKLGATTQFDVILRTAAEELSQVLGGSEVLVQIQPEKWLNQENA